MATPIIISKYQYYDSICVTKFATIQPKSADCGEFLRKYNFFIDFWHMLGYCYDLPYILMNL